MFQFICFKFFYFKKKTITFQILYTDLSISTIVLVVTFLIAETKHLTKASYGIRWFLFVVEGMSVLVGKAHRQMHDAADHIISTVTRKE